MFYLLIAECRYAEYHYDKCRYAECLYAECRGAVPATVARLKPLILGL
jgi:hypothetical protein